MRCAWRTMPNRPLPISAQDGEDNHFSRGRPGTRARPACAGPNARRTLSPGVSFLVPPSVPVPVPVPDAGIGPAHGTENMFLAFGKLDERNFLTRPLQRPVRVPISPSTLALIFGGIESIARRPCLILSDSSRRVAALHEF